jgi:antitoxin VapB
MASLYIKDPETAELAASLSRRLGVTKTDAVKQALIALDQRVPQQMTVAGLAAALDDWRASHPLPPETGKKADKAFFDRMWDEDV